MPTDLPPFLKKYLALLGKNEEIVLETAKNVKGWIVDNGEVVKERLEKQIDSTATKMGFVKVSDLEELHIRIAELEESVVIAMKDKTFKNSVPRASDKKPAKKTAAKSATPKRSSSVSKKKSVKRTTVRKEINDRAKGGRK